MAIDSKFSWHRPGRLYRDADEILALVRRFRERTLTQREWSHFAHLTVGHHYVLTYGRDEALDRLRRDISAFNLMVGVPNSDERGYHETITAFYLRSIARYLAQIPAEMTLLEQVHGLLNDRLGSKAIIFQFYSKPRLLSVAARRAWLDPDLRPLGDLDRWPREEPAPTEAV